VLVVWIVNRDPAPSPTVVATDAAAPDDAPVAVALCDDVTRPEVIPGAEVIPADLDGEGCDRFVVWDPPILELPEGRDGPRRFQLGEPGDQLAMGDWDCDGRDTPALYRASTGEVFVFDAFADSGERLEVTTTERIEPDGELTVVEDAAGCDAVAVRPAASEA
jgi:hypothetical protein